MKKGAPYRLLISNIRPSGAYIRRILRYGVPAGLQSSCFSLSGLITTSAINSFPETTVTAGAIAQNLDNITDTCIGAFIHSSMTFAAQNHGAGKRDRINKTLIYSLIQVVVTAVVITQTILLFAPQILSLFVEESDPMREVIIATAEEWLGVILPFYFTSGIMYVISGTLRGMGYAVGPMIMNLIGVCGARILWITVFFPMPIFNNLAGLLSVYPMSWTLTAILQGCIAVYAWIKMYKKKKDTTEQAEEREGVSVG
jgi:Na+-driven multidrug efflux pump